MNYEKNIKILTDFEKALGNGQPVNFKIENSDGELKKVSKERFAKWMEEDKNIKTPPKEKLIYGASGDIDSITYFWEIRSKDGVIKESYCQPRSEEEKQQIKKRQEINKKKREQELEEKKENLERQVQNQENSSNSDKQETNQQQNQFQKIDNKDNNSKSIYYGVGVIGLVILVISMLVIWVKKKNKLKIKSLNGLTE